MGDLSSKGAAGGSCRSARVRQYCSGQRIRFNDEHVSDSGANDFHKDNRTEIGYQDRVG